jgi:hypothetical protein
MPYLEITIFFIVYAKITPLFVFLKVTMSEGEKKKYPHINSKCQVKEITLTKRTTSKEMQTYPSNVVIFR